MKAKRKLFVSPLCILLLTIAGCTSPAPSTNSGGVATAPGAGGAGNASSGGAPPAAAISASDNPLDVMTRAMRAQLDAKSYRARVVSSTAGDTNNTMLIEYVAPDRYRMVGEARAGGKTFNHEYVIVGGATYIKAPNGQWVRSPVDAGGMIKAFRDPKMLDELTKTADVKFVGSDTLDGTPTLIYEYTQNNPLGMKMKSTARTWLSVADGLPRKTESEGELNGAKTKTLITISDYNADIKIEAPGK